MRAIALVDLDDTLFQTLRKRPPDIAEVAMTPLAFAQDGAGLGFATPRQNALLAWLLETAWVIPVTGRSLQALRRVRIPYAAAVCAHGAVLLGDDGAPDADWTAEVAAAAEPHAGRLERLADRAGVLAASHDAPLRIRMLYEADTALYVLLKHPDGDETPLHAVADALAPEIPDGWTLHRNGNNVALMPPFLGKAHAVARLLPRLRQAHPEAPILGFGDSLTDAPFMALCDYAVTPTGSQLAARLLA